MEAFSTSDALVIDQSDVWRYNPTEIAMMRDAGFRIEGEDENTPRESMTSLLTPHQ